MLKKLVLGVWCLVLVFEYRVWVRLGTEGIYLLRNTQYMYVGIYIYWLVVWNSLFHILGMSSSQLTNSYFTEG